MWRAEREYILTGAFMLAALVVLAAQLTVGLAGQGRVVLVLLLAGAALAYSPVLEWRWLLAVLVLVILFIPIRVYAVGGNLPFQLEPYRVVVAVLLCGWGAALLIDRRVRLRRSGFEGPFGVVVLAAVCSVVANLNRVDSLQAEVVKSLTFFGSFILVFYLVVSVVRSFESADFLVRVFVLGGTVVAAFAIVESRTGLNVFDHLGRVLPFVTHRTNDLSRGGHLRAFGSAEHPIALSAALVMLVPLAVYLALSHGRRLWWAAGVLLTLGALATRSKTGVVMLVVIVLVYFWLRRRETRRVWPLLLPMLAVVHFAMPGTLGTFRASFFPEEGLIAQQETSAGSCSSAGRVADLGPSLAEAARKPLLGVGYGTRVVTGQKTNACILDDQWLGTLLEAGAVAVAAWLWLFICFIRRMQQYAREDVSERGWLVVALVASVAAYAIGMFTFDAFSFIQVTFLLYIFLGLGAALLSIRDGDQAAADRS
jgi:polysaccharide biosynthesis protein PslJ